VTSDICRRRLLTRLETVCTDTPECSATSRMVGRLRIVPVIHPLYLIVKEGEDGRSHIERNGHVRMQDKVCVVTGAGTGIGRAIAERLASEGALTLCADIDADAVQATAAGIEAAGGRAQAHVCDVSDPDQVEAVMAAAERHGRPHAIVSKAARPQQRTGRDTAPEGVD